MKMEMWRRVTKFDRAGCALADRHYNRRKVGSPQFMPPGQTIVLLTADNAALFGWWRPDPASGIPSINGLDGWTCTIFRNEGPVLSSVLILDAERAIAEFGYDCGPDGLLTYVWDKRIRSTNPGSCFKHAGWRAIGRSADRRKTLLSKPHLSAAQASRAREGTAVQHEGAAHDAGAARGGSASLPASREEATGTRDRVRRDSTDDFSSGHQLELL